RMCTRVPDFNTRRYSRSLRSTKSTASPARSRPLSNRSMRSCGCAVSLVSARARVRAGTCGALALDLAHEAAETAARTECRHPAAFAGSRCVAVRRGKLRLPRPEELVDETQLRSGHGRLQPVQDVLVDELRCPNAVRTFVDDIVDAAEERVRG